MKASINVRSGTIGPAHDPYGTTTVTVVTEAGKKVEHYSDGLYGLRVTVDKVVLLSSRQDDKAAEAAAEALFLEHSGMTLDAAVNQYEEEWVEDPMDRAYAGYM